MIHVISFENDGVLTSIVAQSLAVESSVDSCLSNVCVTVISNI